MEALLGASQSNPTCGSVADLQHQLRDLLDTRVTETRADHTSVTFEIRATAVFDIPVTENENGALENAFNIDPLLGGARSSVAPVVNGNGTPATRRVNAIDTLINQPVDDPVLQTSITRHIIASLGQVDGSSWMVRHVSRGEQGWTFTYICKDSWQAWSRQATKHPAKTAIGEWSETAGQDPVHLTRPAFDCRGSVKIAFVKSTKTIDVKYEHTPMHKTVAQLIELLAPPPIMPIVKTPAKKAKEPRPPKEPKPKTPRSSKKRVGENGVPDGEGSQPKKRRKKINNPAGTVLPPEMPGALPVGNSSARQLYNAQAGTSGGVQPGGSSSYPEGLVSSANEGVPDGDVHAHSILNLPPGEAARRREVAIKLLSDNNLDPKTLSAEQFNIFANQSPELQRDSLAMLVKYGAERLRIVHPNKDAASSGQSTPNKQSTPGPAQESPHSAKPKKARKAVSEVKSAGAANGQGPEAAEGSKRKRICDNCRIKRYKGKCDKARPSCSMCIADGAACVYSAPKPRQSKAAEAVPEAPVTTNGDVPNEEPDDLGSPGFHAEPAGQPVHEPFHHSVNDPGHGQEQYDGHAHHHSADVPETPSAVFNTSHGIYHHSSGLSFPQVSPSSAAEPSHSNNQTAAMEPPSIDYMSNSVAESSEPPLHNFNYPQPPPAPQTASGYTEHSSPAFEPGRRGSSGGQASASRRSLPTSQPSHGSGTNDSNMEAPSTWQSMSATPSQPASAIRSSPRQSRTKQPTPASQAYDDLRPQQQASSWASANQSVSQTAQPVRNSPSQSAAQPARAKSRQSNRAQSRTQVNSMSAARQAPTQGTQSLAHNSGYASAAATEQPSSAQNYNYNKYQSGNTQDSTSSDHVAYQPYSNNQPSAQSSSYSSFDNYNARVPNAASSTLSGSGSQNVASSYPSNSAATTSNAQWGTSTSTSQARNTRGYNTTQSASSTAYNSSNTPQSQSLQGFSVRAQPQAQTRSSSTTYSQQLQQQQQRQQQQHGQQQHQQQGYSGYMNQQQQQQPTTNSQQNWGYGFGAANSSSSGYNSATAAGSGNNAAYPAASATSHGTQGHGHASHGHQTQQQQQQHRSMNLSSHTYMEHDQALYDLLRSNPAG